MTRNRPELLWFDGEFTGLNATHDLVLEVAAISTDAHLNIISEFSTPIKHNLTEAERLMLKNPWWIARPDHKKAVLDDIFVAGQDINDVSNSLVGMLEIFNGRPAYLAGNTINTDRKFIERDFPTFETGLHYRMLDVSSLKIISSLMLGVAYSKEEKHRALADIHESLEELKYLLRKIGNPTLQALLKQT